METENPLVAALHTHIQAVAQRPIDVRMLVELEKTCLLARELMVVGKAPTALQKHSLIGGFPNNALGYDDGAGGIVTPSYTGIGSAAFSSPQETFGVTAIRELVSLLPSLMPKPPEPYNPQPSVAELVSAVSIAKASGDSDLEQQLREALRQRMGTLPVMVAADNADETVEKPIETEGAAA